MAAFLRARVFAAHDRQVLAIWCAWHSGVIAKATKTPGLDELLPPDPRPRRKQTPEEQFAIALAWNAKLGGAVVPR